MGPNTPLTNEQRNAVTQIYASNVPTSSHLGTAKSVDERARRPDPDSVPPDITVRVEIVPPSPQPHPLLDGTGVLKTPERVPVYFYSIRNDNNSRAESDAELANTRVIFFIHGGGNVAFHPTFPPFIQFYAQLLRGVTSSSIAPGDAAAIKCVLIAPSYRLATVPENVFPAALQDLVAAYDYVLGKGYDPSSIIIAGDSAGGNHALVLTHLVLHSSRPPPRGVIPIAPSAMKVYDYLSDHAKAQAGKDILDVPMLEEMLRAYLGDSGVSCTNPLVSGAFIDFAASWPRTLILVGTGDLLIDASREVERRLAALGRPVELVEYDERPHGWWIFPEIFPENIQDGVERIARFIRH